MAQDHAIRVMGGRVRWEDWAVNCGQLLIVVVTLRVPMW
jgi:hypothetical protein